MPLRDNHMIRCQVCRLEKKQSDMLPGSLIRPAIVSKIRAAVPDWDANGFICLKDLNRFRAEYVQSVVEEDKGELTDLEHQVVKSLNEQELITKNLNLEYDRKLTLGQRTADKIADFGGSWKFIGIFAVTLVLWMLVNSARFFTAFDPYPFIFLNLILSCLAAIQAPVIMMSQNRQEERDRMHAEYDYRINLKAELEVRQLHEKMDHLLVNQWQRLLEIQEIQTELMEELARRK